MSFRFEHFVAWKRAIEFADKMFEVADGLPRGYQSSLGEQVDVWAGVRGASFAAVLCLPSPLSISYECHCNPSRLR